MIACTFKGNSGVNRSSEGSTSGNTQCALAFLRIY